MYTSYRPARAGLPMPPAPVVGRFPRAGTISATGHGATATSRGAAAPVADPAGLGAGRIGRLTVVYDAGSTLGRRARKWLAGRAHAVPLEFVAAGSPDARRRFVALDRAGTLRDLTVISDTGLVWTGDDAWLACLWALADYRRMAKHLRTPALPPAARRFIPATAAVRVPAGAGVRGPAGAGVRGPAGAGDYGGLCDDRRRPA
jgi:predicted DCC family thiol-disulfide oxidoreductase YuxK